MSEFLKNWVYALAGAGLICAAAAALSPEGKWRRITSLCCGLVMIIALVSPLKSFDAAEYGRELYKYRAAASEAAGKSEDIQKRLNRSYIEDECEAYILDKAENDGVSLSAQVTARWDTGGWWYPYEAEIKAGFGGEEREKLAGEIESELGIARQRQYWSDTDE
jgi:hypothetical protein